MTERPLSITTQIATPLQAAFNSTASISANDALPVIESADEEPYTIKCICDFSDDDGNTIYCETCDTWQHIECFYPGRVDDASREEFDHSCADCKPRPLDRRHATERQRHQRQNKAINDSGDKKTKRPPSKSHKKKSKPSDLQVNGYHDHDGHKNGSPQEHHPHTKKTKGHRSNQSVSSQLKRSPPFNARPHNHAHPPSPAHTPPDLPNNFQVHGYSENFLTLYDQDHPSRVSSSNSFASLPVTNTLALWLQDPEKLQEDAGVDKHDVFQFLKVPTDQLKWPDLHVERKEATINDTILRWKQLITPTNLPQAGRIGELNGLLGFQKDYCSNPENRWPESAHPRPFVFFHPRLPLYIDTRQEGSICRYVRRSCRANTNLETFIALGNEYHFWLTSERALAANEQITIPWDFRFLAQHRSRYLHLLNLSDDDGAPFDGAEITHEEYDQLTQTIDLVLSDHGGCACDLGNDCAFARFHRNFHGRSHTQSNGVKLKKGRKPKQNHVSPTSTGHATNSRAASEGQQEQYDDDDARSISGSVRSKPHSRDLTPSHGVGETNGILTEPSDREKRKLAMLEDSFRKMEQGQPPRKKKRPSDSSTVNVPVNTTTLQSTPKPRQRSVAPRMSISQPTTTNSNGHRSRQYVDASTSRRQSGSPFSALSPTAALPSPENQVSRTGSTAYRSRQASAAPKSTYSDASTQTEDVENAWWKDPKPKHKRSVVPLSKRLLKNRHKLQIQLEVQTCQQAVISKDGEEESVRASPTASIDLDVPMHEERYHLESPTDAKGRNPSISSSTPSVDLSSTSPDVAMTDAPSIQVSTTIKPPPPPWPGQSNTSLGAPSAAQKSPDLRVQMPPAPVFSTPNMSGPLSGPVTPSSGSGSIAQSPLGTVHPTGVFALPIVNGVGQHPSPVKTTKKLSLSDYKAARMKKSDTFGANKASSGSSPTVAPAVLKPSFSTVEEAKAQGILEGSAIIDSPMVEKSADPLGSGAGATSDPAFTHNMSLEKSNGTL
jgi:uncharacterized protein